MFITAYSTIVLHHYSHDHTQEQRGEVMPPRAALRSDLDVRLLYESGALLGMGFSYPTLTIDLAL